MLTIVLGFVLAVVFGILATALLKNDGYHGVTVIVTCTLGFGLYIGLCCPVSGFHEWVLVEETELISLSNDLTSSGNEIVYVAFSADDTYTYRYEIDSEFGTDTSKEYQTETLVGENVEEIEDHNCEIPFIRVYERKGKMSIWTFALGSKETKYVFYVPEGTISKEEKLN